MSSSSSQRNKEERLAADLAETTAEVEEKNSPRRRMTQEQIDGLIRYETVHMPEDYFRRLSLRSKELLTPANLAYQGNLPVPMGQIDDYIANILSEINESEARFMQQRDRILNDYYTKGYAEEQEPPAAAQEEPPAVPNIARLLHPLNPEMFSFDRAIIQY